MGPVPGPGPGPGFSLQQIKCPSLPVKLLAMAVLGTCVRVAAESESFSASGSKVATECPVQSQETLLKKLFQQTVGPEHWTVSQCDRDSEGYVTSSLQSQLFQQYVNVSETQTGSPVGILRPKWNFLSPKVKIRFQLKHLLRRFAYKVKI